MKLEQSFDVRAPIEDVWAALIDVQRVAPCLPGAEITEARDDGSYHGTFQVKLGPTTAAYDGDLRLESVDEAAHVAVMQAQGRDKRGQGNAKATITSRLTQAGDRTEVAVDADFTITGRLARFGRGGMMQDISDRLLREFAECLQRRMEPRAAGGASPPEEPARPVSGLRLFFQALWARIRRAFRSGS